MDRKIVTYSLILSLLTIIGCAKDDFPQKPEVIEPQPEVKVPERLFNIFANLPSEEATRANVTDEKTLTRCWATCFNHSNKKLKMLPSDTYFQHEEFDDTIIDGKKFFMPKHEVKCKAPYEGGDFEFFASYPSAEEMSDSCGVKYGGIDNHNIPQARHDGYFTIDNNSKSSPDSTTVTIDYAIARFKIAPDIAKQVDFMTARSKGKVCHVDEIKFDTIVDSQGGTTKVDYETISVQLDFEHQLSRIKLLSWGNNDKYIYEIAGLRLGNAVVEGRFQYNTLKTMPNGSGPAFVGKWSDPEKVKGKVEYIFHPGDKIVILDGKTANEKGKAVSIMGKSNYSMVIPGKNDKWERPADPSSVSQPYTTTQSYISVLMRVRHNKDKYGSDKMIYPYQVHSNEAINGKMDVVYLAVNKSGVVVAQVYKGKNDDEFFTDIEMTQRYQQPAEVTIKDFGWAAAPLAVNWEVGKNYEYKLNYSNGIGVHDPSDPYPGTPITEQDADAVTFTMTVSDWNDFGEAEKIHVGTDEEAAE